MSPRWSRRAKVAQDRIAATAGADRAGRLAFVAVSLRAAVERGEPFATGARGRAAAGRRPEDARALEPFAATGVPRAAALARELSQLTGAMLNAAGAPPREGGFIDRLQQNAERLVRIRPINEAPGDDAATVISRADVKATHGDIAGGARRGDEPAGGGACAGAGLDPQGRGAQLRRSRRRATSPMARSARWRNHE